MKQERITAFMANPATHGGAPVERVDTAISRVFLAGRRAYKMKRAIKTNFLDFSTLARREASCRRELEINYAARSLYLDVAAVTAGPEGLSIGGDGAPVEWLTVMRRFDRTRELDRLLAVGALEFSHVERLADVVAEMHAEAPRASADAADDHEVRIAQIADAVASSVPRLRPRAQDWAGAALSEAAALAPLAARRLPRGRVRRCHGDLHLGNIVMLHGRPTPFDALEFDERLASIDVLYDVAMAQVDLILSGRPDLGCALISRYLSWGHDAWGLGLLPMFLSMRAAVRALSASGDSEVAAERLKAAVGFLARPAPPFLLAVGGMSGSGKTTLARAVAHRLSPPIGALTLRSDVLRKRLFGVCPETPLAPDAYRPEVTRRVMRRLALEARRVLGAGLSTVLDATFLDDIDRRCAAAQAATAGVRFLGVWLDLPAEEAARRVAARSGDASDADPTVVARQAARADPPEGWLRLDADRPTSELADAVLRAVRA